MAFCSSGRPMPAASSLQAARDAEVNWLAAEQSNSSLTVGDVLMLKIYRRISPGIHPEAEMGRYLTEQGFSHAPPLFGDVVRDRSRWHTVYARRRARIRPPSRRRLVVDPRPADARTRRPCPERSLPKNRKPICSRTARPLSRRSAVVSARCMRCWRGKPPSEAFAPKVAKASDAAQWAEKIEERIAKALRCDRQAPDLGARARSANGQRHC